MTAMKKEKMMTMLYRFLLVLLLMGSSLALGSVAFSATMPEYQRLDSIVKNAGNPTSVAVDSKGRIYVAEMVDDKVSVYSQGGKLLATRYRFGKPVSIEVDTTTDTVLVGTLDGVVTAYTTSFSRKFTLAGFGRPSDIAVDGSGKIYVLDKDNGVVKIYANDGTPAGTIGSPGSGNGQLYQPTGIAIDEANGEIVVLDHQLTFDIFANTDVEGARFQFFAMNGVFKRAYSKFGYKMDLGQLVRPVGVAVDGQSRVYVTDTRLNKIMVYDNNGAFLGMVDSALQPLRAPLGLAITDSNLLYVTFSRTIMKGVDVYGLDAFSASLVSPANLSFTATVGGNDPQAQVLNINNIGNTPLDWTASGGAEWVTATPANGTIDALAEGSTDVAVNIGTFEPGQYVGAVTVVSGTGAAEEVTISLTVKPNPMRVAPASINVQTTVGANPAGQALSISNIGDGDLNWKATVSDDWMTLSAVTGTTPTTLNVLFNTSALAVGTYNGTVTVMQQGDNPCPIAIAVNLVVNESGVSTSPVKQLPAAGSSVKVRGKVWTMVQAADASTSLNGVNGTGADDAYAVGTGGAILHTDGTDWTAQASANTNDLNAVYGTTAVGAAGTVVDVTTGDATTDGTADFTDIYTDTKIDTTDGTSVWVSTEGTMFRTGKTGLLETSADGNTWTTACTSPNELYSVWGAAADDVYAVGAAGTVVHYDGSCTETNETDASLNGIWGSNSGDIYAVGSKGNVLHYNGNKWTKLMDDSSASVVLNDVWCSGNSVIAVGEGGLILTAQKNGFPWNSIIGTITTRAALKMQVQEEKKDQK